MKRAALPAWSPRAPDADGGVILVVALALASAMAPVVLNIGCTPPASGDRVDSTDPVDPAASFHGSDTGALLPSSDDAADDVAGRRGSRIASALEEIPGVARARVLVASRPLLPRPREETLPVATAVVYVEEGVAGRWDAARVQAFVAGALGAPEERVNAFVEVVAAASPSATAAPPVVALHRVGPLELAPPSAGLLRALLWGGAVLLLLLGGSLLWMVSRVRSVKRGPGAG